MSKFNLEVRALDKLTGNVYEVRKDELSKFINYYNEKIEELEECKSQKQDLMKSKSDINEKNLFLETENRRMKDYIKRLENSQVLDSEIGKNSVVSKQDKIIKELEKNNEKLLKKIKAMEELYLEKISELMGNVSKKSIEKTIKDSVKNTLEELLNYPETEFNFEIKG